jgi:serine/threonine-protein kinase HSL1 (negative regulator of Swe1 kinase)
MPSRKHIRSQSGYSILNDEHLYSKHSFYDPPPSDGSYDPFRASRDPIIPEQTSDRNVTVHRGSDGGSRRVRPVTALGHRSGSSLRILALKNSKHQSGSIRSRNSSKRSNPSTRSQHSSIAARRRSISRSSMASSHWPSSPPVIVHPGSLGKRGVSFSHLRRSSITSGTTAGTAGPHYTPEQRRFLNGSRDSAAVSVLSSPRPPQVRLLTKPVASPILPRLRVRKPESPSKYINTEARKVSMELVKVMDEAFNRSSIGSSIRTTATELNTNKEMPEYDSPPTSFTITRDSGASAIATPLPRAVLQNRPLPPIPNETPNTFLQRKLAETRAEIARRIEHDGDNTEHFNEVLERLDQLMLPVTTGAKRTSSAPAKSPEQPHILPVIEEVKDGEDRYEPYRPHHRAVTDPVRPAHQVRRAVTESIRVVDHSPTPIAPLNIRKRSGASTASSRSVNEDVAVPWPGPLPPKTAYDDSAQVSSVDLFPSTCSLSPLWRGFGLCHAFSDNLLILIGSFYRSTYSDISRRSERPSCSSCKRNTESKPRSISHR